MNWMRITIVLLLTSTFALAAEPPIRLTGTLGAVPTGTSSAKGEGLEAFLPKPEFAAEAAGKPCWTIPPGSGEERFVYVKITDPRVKDGSMKVKVSVEALDTPGVLQIDYDGYLTPWKNVSVPRGSSGQWKTFELELPDATFLNRCNGYDFRLVSDQAMSIAKIDVELVERTLPPDNFDHHWDLAKLTRKDLARCGFAHGGCFWGAGGMTKEIYEKELDLTKELGFGWIRYWPEWAMLEPEKGKFDWTLSDYMLAEAKKRGIQMVGLVAFDTMWAADAPDAEQGWGRSKYPPKNLQDLGDYVAVLVSRYKNDVHCWEGWNEQNAVGGFWKIPPSGRDPVEHYVAWQKTFYEAAKKADPACTVLTGGFADDAMFASQLIGYYEKGLCGTFDAMNIHIYGMDPRGRWETGQIESVIRIMRHYGDGDKKIWVTETGWAVEKHPQAISVEKQAEWAPWQFAVLLNYPQVEHVFYYQLRDTSSSEVFGWYAFDFVPRPVVAKWKEFLRTIKGHD